MRRRQCCKEDIYSLKILPTKEDRDYGKHMALNCNDMLCVCLATGHGPFSHLWDRSILRGLNKPEWKVCRNEHNTDIALSKPLHDCQGAIATGML